MSKETVKRAVSTKLLTEKDVQKGFSKFRMFFRQKIKDNPRKEGIISRLLKGFYRFWTISFMLLLFLGSILAFADSSAADQYRDIYVSSQPVFIWSKNTNKLLPIDSDKAQQILSEHDIDDLPKIGTVSLAGSIVQNCGISLFGEENAGLICANEFLQFVDYAKYNQKLLGLVLNINSPGGELTASDIIYKSIKDATKYMPVYVFVSDMIASGGVYISVPATKIYASSYAAIGNIGVLAQFLDYREFFKKLGIKEVRFVSSSAKYKAMDGLLDGNTGDIEDKYFQEILDAGEKRFHFVVKSNRPIKQKDIVFSGLIFSAVKAKEFGLIDDIVDNQSEVLKDLLKQVDSSEPYVVVYQYSYGKKESLLGLPIKFVKKFNSLVRGGGKEYRLLVR